MEHMPPSDDLPRDILQRAVQVARALGNLTTAHLATGTRNPLTDHETTEIDPRTIAQWVWTVLNTGLHGRSADERNHFFRVVRSQPDVLRGMFVQSMTHPRGLQEGIEPVLRRRPQVGAQPPNQAANLIPPDRILVNPPAHQRANLVPLTQRPTQRPIAAEQTTPQVPNPRVRPPTPTPPATDPMHRARTATTPDQQANAQPSRANTTFAMEWNRYLTGQTAAPPPHPATVAAAAAAGAQGGGDANANTQGTAANRFGGRAMLSGLFGRMGNPRPNGQPNEER